MALPDLDLASGEGKLGPYRVVRPISAGGMARVYEARHESLAGVTTRVAIKVILPDYAHEESFRELFITEARLSARLEHQNLVRIQQFNKEGELYYLVMEYIDGLTLRRIISGCQRNNVRLPVPVIAELGRQICDGLHYAHTLRSEEGSPLGLVHRDIKPTNVMLNAQGVAKVLDFGISAAHGAHDAGDGVKGTWGYMSLEQAEQRDVGPAADVFGVAAVLYELAALAPLFPEKEPDAIREALRTDQAARRAAALGGPYGELGGVLVRALQRDPAARHRGAASFGRVLSTLVPDPVGIHDALTRLVRDLRHLEGGAVTGVQERARATGRNSLPAPAPASRPVPPAVAIPIEPAVAKVPVPSPVPPASALPVQVGGAAGPSVASPAAKVPPAPPEVSRRTWMFVGGAVVLLLALGAWALGGDEAPPTRAAVIAKPATLAAVPAEVPAAKPSLEVQAPAAAPSAAVAGPAPHAGVAVVPRPAAQPLLVTPSAPPAPVAPQAAAPSATVPERIAPTTTVSAPVSVAAAPSPPAAKGLLSLGAVPRAQVQIDGVFVGYTPLHDHSVAPGTRTVTMVAENYRAKQFTLDVPSGGKVTRVYYFAEGRFQTP